MAKQQQYGLKDCLGAALDTVCQNGDDWVIGSEKFWDSLKDDGLTIPQAIHRALWAVPGIGKRDVNSAKETFWTMFRSTRSDETPTDDA